MRRFLISIRCEPQEAAQGEDHLYQGSARRPGVPVREDEVSRHLHEGGGRHQDQLARITSTSK